ncbi:hypothetical protein AGMMS50225_20930 [Betaproteobacteria bacterium]|nr:hypothetical protein AGMMS50225_20930 [Betaproteobacteria bacterium]
MSVDKQERDSLDSPPPPEPDDVGKLTGKSRWDRLEQEIADLKRETADLKRAIGGLKRSLTVAETETEKAHEDAAQARRERDSLLGPLQAENDSLRANYELLEKTNKSLSNKVFSLQADVECMRRHEAEINAGFQQREAKLKQREAELKQWEAAITEKQKALNGAQHLYDEAVKLAKECGLFDMKVRERAVLEREDAAEEKEGALEKEALRLQAWEERLRDESALLAERRAALEALILEILQGLAQGRKLCPQCSGLGGLDSSAGAGCPKCGGTGFVSPP